MLIRPIHILFPLNPSQIIVTFLPKNEEKLDVQSSLFLKYFRQNWVFSLYTLQYYNMQTNEKKMMQNVNINQYNFLLLTDTLTWL